MSIAASIANAFSRGCMFFFSFLIIVGMLGIPGTETSAQGASLVGDCETATSSFSYDGDESLLCARVNGEISGSGTTWDPFVIQGFAIDSYSSYAIKLSNTRSHVVIMNGTIRGGPTDKHQMEGAITLMNSSNVVVYNVILTTITYIGIWLHSCSDIKIVQNYLYNVNWSAINVMSSANVAIEQNVIDSCGAVSSGIFVDSNCQSQMIVASNTIIGRWITQHGIWISYGIGILIRRNMIIENAQHGIEISQSMAFCNITENVFYKNKLNFIIPEEGTKNMNNTITNNMFYNGSSVVGFDSDGDGMSDAEEIQNHSTNPYHADTDFDGFSDAVELYVAMSDPLVPESFPPSTLAITLAYKNEIARYDHAVMVVMSWIISTPVTGLDSPFIVLLDNQLVSNGSFRAGMPVTVVLPRLSLGSYTCTIIAANGLGSVARESVLITVRTATETADNVGPGMLRWATFLISFACCVVFLNVIGKSAHAKRSRLWEV